MPVFVYVLQSQSRGTFYTGISKNLPSRLRQHNQGQSAGTRGKGPWVVVFKESYDDYSSAREREKWLKSGKGRDWLRSAFGG